MIIEISRQAADDADAQRSLDRILIMIEEGWHLWGGDDLEELANSRLVRGQGRAERRAHDLLKAAITRGAYPARIHRRQVRVVLSPAEADDLRPEDAAEVAESPVIVLVENREADGDFLRRVVAELDRSLHRYWNAGGRERVVIDSVGGKGQMELQVKRACEGRPRPRLVVIVDSDRRTPSSPASPEATRLHACCERYGVSCWLLRKREAENYLPRALLEARSDAGREHRRRVDAWGQLTPDQKDHYDMKDGLATEPYAEEEALFAALAPEVRAALTQGFGPRIGKCWQEWSGVQARAELVERSRGDLEQGLELLRSQV